MPYRKVKYIEQVWYIIKYKATRSYHRWCLRNAIAYHGMSVRIYHASTNSYTVQSNLTGFKYHAFVDANGKIKFEGMLDTAE